MLWQGEREVSSVDCGGIFVIYKFNLIIFTTPGLDAKAYKNRSNTMKI